MGDAYRIFFLHEVIDIDAFAKKIAKKQSTYDLQLLIYDYSQY